MPEPKFTHRSDRLNDLLPIDRGYFSVPSATREAAAQQAPERVEPRQVEDLSRATQLPASDFSPGVSTNASDAQSYGIFLLEQALAGVGFGGFLPPGAMCMLTPMGRRSELVAMTSQHAIARDLATLCCKGPTQPLSAAGTPSNMPFGSVLLRPGEAVSFGRLVTGLCGVFFNVWETPILSQNFPGVNPPPYPAQTLGGGNGANNLFNDFGVVGPTFRPYLRVFTEPHAVPRAIDYTKVAKVTSFVPQSNATGGSPWLFNVGASGATPLSVANALYDISGYAFCLIPPGTKHLTLAVASTTSGQGTNAGVVSGTSAPGIQSLSAMNASGTPIISAAQDMQIWWLMADGVLHKHPADQWTATGRGQLSSTHDLESYSIPNNAVGVMPYITNISLFTSGFPWCTFIMTED